MHFYIAVFLFLISGNFVLAQDISYPQSAIDSADEQCVLGKEMALENIAKGQIHVITYGKNTFGSNQDFNEFHKRFILLTYDVKIGYGGSSTTRFLDCYTALMRDTVLSRYGSTFFKRAENEARLQYHEQIRRRIAADELFSHLDTISEYIGDPKSLPDWIKDKARLRIHENCRIALSFVVEKDGSLSTIKVLLGVNSSFDKKVVEQFKKCPKWKPGYLMGQKVRSERWISFTFKADKGID